MDRVTSAAIGGQRDETKDPAVKKKPAMVFKRPAAGLKRPVADANLRCKLPGNGRKRLRKKTPCAKARTVTPASKAPATPAGKKAINSDPARFVHGPFVVDAVEVVIFSFVASFVLSVVLFRSHVPTAPLMCTYVLPNIVAARQIYGVVKLVVRKEKEGVVGQAYLMDVVGYLGGLTAAATPDYKDNVNHHHNHHHNHHRNHHHHHNHHHHNHHHHHHHRILWRSFVKNAMLATSAAKHQPR